MGIWVYDSIAKDGIWWNNNHYICSGQKMVYGFLLSHHQGFLETGNKNHCKSLLIHWWPSPNMAYMQVFTLAHISHWFYPPSLLSDFLSSSPACCVGQSPPIISPIRIAISEFLYTKYRSSTHHITILWSYITILPPYHLPSGKLTYITI